jgi:hypothetical protein
VQAIGWSDQASTLEEIARKLAAIAKLIRTGKKEAPHAVPAFPQRNY